MALGYTQSLAGMRAENVSVSKARPAHKADNLGNVCEPVI
jgi:hypothetical protein